MLLTTASSQDQLKDLRLCLETAFCQCPHFSIYLSLVTPLYYDSAYNSSVWHDQKITIHILQESGEPSMTTLNFYITISFIYVSLILLPL